MGSSFTKLKPKQAVHVGLVPYENIGEFKEDTVPVSAKNLVALGSRQKNITQQP